MNISTEKKIMDLENGFVAAQGEAEGVGGIRNLGLMDSNYCFWNGLTMRSRCVALRTISRYFQWSMTVGEKICILAWVTGHTVQWEKKLCWGNNNKKKA